MMVTNVLTDAIGHFLTSERRVNGSQFLTSMPVASATGAMAMTTMPGTMMESGSVQPMVSPAAAAMLLCELIRHGWTPPGMLRVSAMTAPMGVVGNNCAMGPSNMMGHSMSARRMGDMSGMVEAMPSQEMPMGATATRVPMHGGAMGGTFMAGSAMASGMAGGMSNGMDSRGMGPGCMSPMGDHMGGHMGGEMAGEMTGGMAHQAASGPAAGMVSMGMRSGMTNH